MPAETSTPWQPIGEAEGTTSSAPSQDTYAESLAGLVDKHLLSRISTVGYGSIVVLIWFVVIAWLFASDQYEGRLNDWVGLGFLGIKVVAFSLVGLVAAGLLRRKGS
jgi:hypothetical protein